MLNCPTVSVLIRANCTLTCFKMKVSLYSMLPLVLPPSVWPLTQRTKTSVQEVPNSILCFKLVQRLKSSPAANWGPRGCSIRVISRPWWLRRNIRAFVNILLGANQTFFSNLIPSEMAEIKNLKIRRCSLTWNLFKNLVEIRESLDPCGIWTLFLYICSPIFYP